MKQVTAGRASERLNNNEDDEKGPARMEYKKNTGSTSDEEVKQRSERSESDGGKTKGIAGNEWC
jgi:hypothetical protein